MSDGLAYAGGALLAAATLPQAARILRERRAPDLSWAFVALNLAGILLLAYRSWEIREGGFLAVNAVTATFWALVLVVKALSEGRAPRRAAKSAGAADPDDARGAPAYQNG